MELQKIKFGTNFRHQLQKKIQKSQKKPLNKGFVGFYKWQGLIPVNRWVVGSSPTSSAIKNLETLDKH